MASQIPNNCILLIICESIIYQISGQQFSCLWLGPMTQNVVGYSLTASKDKIVAIHEAAKVIVNLACLCLLIGWRGRQASMFLSACICNIFLFVIWQSPISFPDGLALVSSYLRRIQYCKFFILVDKLIVFFFKYCNRLKTQGGGGGDGGGGGRGLVRNHPCPTKSLCGIFMDIYLFFFQTETNVVPWDAPIAVGILLVATDVYARVVTIPLATTVQVNLLLPCTGGHPVELSVTEHALSKSWGRVKL